MRCTTTFFQIVVLPAWCFAASNVMASSSSTSFGTTMFGRDDITNHDDNASADVVSTNTVANCSDDCSPDDNAD